MKNLYFLIILVGLLAACTQKQSNKSLSPYEEEENGVKEVGKAFGGQCIYSRDTTLPQGLIITLADADAIEGQNPNKFFYQVAEAFCKKNINKESKYKSLCVILSYKNKTTARHCFLMENLTLAMKKMPLIVKVVRLIKDENYDSIQSLLASRIIADTHNADCNRSNMISKLKDADSSGNITDFYPSEFWVEHFRNRGNMFQLIGVVKREKGNYDINICVDASENKDSIYMLVYKPEGFYNKNN